MTLTPEEIVNKRFQATKFREGYDQDEVDDYLDEIVVELRRVLKENKVLRKRLSDGGVGVTQVVGTQTGQITSVQANRQHEVRSQVGSQGSSEEDMRAAQDSASNVIMMAQKLHDQHVNEGIQKRDELISKAENDSESLVNDAQGKRDQIVEGLQKEKAILETKIEQLRAFDRDYRARLKSYIESHLRDLDVSGSISNDMRPMASMPAAQPVGTGKAHATGGVPGIPTATNSLPKVPERQKTLSASGATGSLPRLETPKTPESAGVRKVTGPVPSQPSLPPTQAMTQAQNKVSPASAPIPTPKTDLVEKIKGKDKKSKGKKDESNPPTGTIPKFTTKAFKKDKK